SEDAGRGLEPGRGPPRGLASARPARLLPARSRADGPEGVRGLRVGVPRRGPRARGPVDQGGGVPPVRATVRHDRDPGALLPQLLRRRHRRGRGEAAEGRAGPRPLRGLRAQERRLPAGAGRARPRAVRVPDRVRTLVGRGGRTPPLTATAYLLSLSFLPMRRSEGAAALRTSRWRLSAISFSR